MQARGAASQANREQGFGRGLPGPATSWLLTSLGGCHNLLGRPCGKTCSLLTASARCRLLIGAECGSVRDTRFRSLEFCGEGCCEAVDRAWIVQRTTGRQQVSCPSLADWYAACCSTVWPPDKTEGVLWLTWAQEDGGVHEEVAEAFQVQIRRENPKLRNNASHINYRVKAT